MPFRIETFKASVSKSGGFSMASDFDVIVPTTIGGKNIGGESNFFNLGGNVSETMSYRIDSFTLPSRSVETTDYSTYGPTTKIGLMANYVDVEMTVILSPDLRERDYFMKWQDLIVGQHREENKNADQVRSNFDVGYYKDYISDGITLRKFNNYRTVPIYECRLIGAFPSQVGALPLNWETFEVIRLPVTISFRHFIEKTNKELNYPELYNVIPGSVTGRILGALPKLPSLPSFRI